MTKYDLIERDDSRVINNQKVTAEVLAYSNLTEEEARKIQLENRGVYNYIRVPHDPARPSEKILGTRESSSPRSRGELDKLAEQAKEKSDRGVAISQKEREAYRLVTGDKLPANPRRTDIITREELEKQKQTEKEKRVTELTKKIQTSQAVPQKAQKVTQNTKKDRLATQPRQTKTIQMGEGYVLQTKETTARGTVLASPDIRESELSLYERSQYNKYLLGKQTYKDYKKKVETKTKQLTSTSNNIIQPSQQPKTISQKLVRAGDIARFKLQREQAKAPGLKSQFKRVYYGLGYTGATFAGSAITGGKNIISYAKRHPFRTAGAVGLVLLPEAVSSATGSAMLAGAVKVGAGAYFSYKGSQYAVSTIKRIQESPAKLETIGQATGEVGTTAIAYKVISKTPSLIRKGSSKIQAIYESRKLTQKFKGQIIRKPGGELAKIIKQPSTKIKVRGIKGYEGTYYRQTVTRKLQGEPVMSELGEAAIKPVYTKPYYVTSEQLSNLPKNYLVNYQIQKQGIQILPKRTSPRGLSVTGAVTYKTIQKGKILTSAKDIQARSVPQRFTSELPAASKMRYLEAGTIQARVQGITLSKGKDLIVPKKAYKTYKKPGSMEFEYQPQVDFKPLPIDYSRRVLAAGTQKGMVAIYQSFFTKRLSKIESKAPLEVISIKVAAKPITSIPKTRPVTVSPPSRDTTVYVERSVGNMKVLQAVKVKQKAASKLSTVQELKPLQATKQKQQQEQQQKAKQTTKSTIEEQGAIISQTKFSKVKQAYDARSKSKNILGSLSQLSTENLQSLGRQKSQQIAIQKPAIKTEVLQAPMQKSISRPAASLKPVSSLIPRASSIPRSSSIPYSPVIPGSPSLPKSPSMPAAPSFLIPRRKAPGQASFKKLQVKVKQPKSFTPTGTAALFELKGKTQIGAIKSGLGQRLISKKKRRR